MRKLGVVDFATMDNFVTGTLMPALAGAGVGSHKFSDHPALQRGHG